MSLAVNVAWSVATKLVMRDAAQSPLWLAGRHVARFAIMLHGGVGWGGTLDGVLGVMMPPLRAVALYGFMHAHTDWRVELKEEVSCALA